LELIDDGKKERTFSKYAQQVHSSETLNIINRFVDKQKKKLNTKELLSNITIPQRFNDLNRKIAKNSRFVGYAITPRESKSININIGSVGLRVDSAQSLTLYVFDPTKESAMTTISTSALTDLRWADVDINIEFDKLDGGAGSTYLIGYFEDDLTGQMYEQDWGKGQTHAAMKITRHYAGIVPVRFSNSTLSGTNCPDMQYLEGAISCQTPGFGLRFNVKCDITDVLVDNINMFGEAVQHAVAIRYLKDAKGNILLNPTISSAQNRATFDQEITDMEGRLYGGLIEDVGYQRGILDNLVLDFSELDAVCFKARADRITQTYW